MLEEGAEKLARAKFLATTNILETEGVPEPPLNTPLNTIVFNSVRCGDNYDVTSLFNKIMMFYWRPLVLRRPIILAPQGGPGSPGPPWPPRHWIHEPIIDDLIKNGSIGQ